MSDRFYSSVFSAFFVFPRPCIAVCPSAAVCPQITCRPRRSVHLRRKTAAPWQLATPWPHVQTSSVEELAIVGWQPPAVAPTAAPTVPPPSDPPLPPGPPPPPLPPPSECACNGIQCCAALAEACYAKAAQRGRPCKRALHYYCKNTCSKAGAGWFRFCGKSATSGCRAHAHNPCEAAVSYYDISEGEKPGGQDWQW